VENDPDDVEEVDTDENGDPYDDAPYEGSVGA
jgi:hypothetical protein